MWHNPLLPQKPDARSSFSFLPHDAGAVLFGGYSRVKANTTAGKQTKGGLQSSKSVLKPTIHQDTWVLRIEPAATDATSSAAPTMRWERRKKPVNSPNPPRAGVTQAYHKGRGIMFGGYVIISKAILPHSRCLMSHPTSLKSPLLLRHVLRPRTPPERVIC